MKEQDDEFTRQVTDALDQGAHQMDAETVSRLYASRRQAMSTIHAQHTGQGILALKRHPALLGLGLVALLLTFAWLGLKQPSTHRPTFPDTSELDIQLLTGEVPPQVFADWSLATRENVETVCLPDS